MTTPFLYGLGTSNSGLLASLLTLESTELNALANGTLIVSSVSGSSGKFTNNDTGAAVFGQMFLTLGAIGSALSAGANVCGWFLESMDSGTTYESTTTQPARPPDFMFYLPATTIGAASTFKAAGIVRIPALQFKVLIMNNSGQALAATSNTVKLAPESVQF